MKKLKIMLLNFVLRYLFNGITEDKILKVVYTNKEKTIGRVFEGIEELSESQVKELAAEARSIKNLSVLKKVLVNTKQVARESLVNKSTSVDDMVASKFMLYTIDLIEQKLDSIASLYS